MSIRNIRQQIEKPGTPTLEEAKKWLGELYNYAEHKNFNLDPYEISNVANAFKTLISKSASLHITDLDRRQVYQLAFLTAKEFSEHEFISYFDKAGRKGEFYTAIDLVEGLLIGNDNFASKDYVYKAAGLLQSSLQLKFSDLHTQAAARIFTQLTLDYLDKIDLKNENALINKDKVIAKIIEIATAHFNARDPNINNDYRYILLAGIMPFCTLPDRRIAPIITASEKDESNAAKALVYAYTQKAAVTPSLKKPSIDSTKIL